jgi:hypothetical protein
MREMKKAGLKVRHSSTRTLVNGKSFFISEAVKIKQK